MFQKTLIYNGKITLYIYVREKDTNMKINLKDLDLSKLSYEQLKLLLLNKNANEIDVNAFANIDLDGFNGAVNNIFEAYEKSDKHDDVDLSEYDLAEIYKAIDSDGNNILDEEELLKLSESINNAKDSLLGKFMNNLNKIFGLNADKAAVADTSEQVSEVIEAGGISGGADSTSGTGSSYSGGGSTSYNSGVNTKKDDTVEELEAKKQKAINEADTQIKAKNNEMDKAVQSSDKVTSELKSQYSQKNTELNNTNSAISASEVRISSLDGEISSLENSIASMTSELDALKSQENPKEDLSSRISSLESQIKQAESEKSAKEAEKEAEIQNKEELEDKKETLTSELSAIEAEIAKADPELVQTLASIKAEISAIESEKASTVSELDKKIEVAKANEKSNAEFLGSMKGSDSIFAGKFVEIATSDEAYAKWNGVSNCCASFVKWCISETAKSLGLSTTDAIAGSCGGLMNLGKQNDAWIDMEKVRTTMTKEEQIEYLKENLKPGMVFVYNSGGSNWHTGIVKQVNADGSWETIEANTSYQGQNSIVYSHHRDIDNTANRLLGFTDMEAIMRKHNNV